MAAPRLAGSFVALVTPFRPDGALDEEALRALVRWHAERGTDGIVPCGTTGESATLTHEEHERVVEVVVDEARRCGGGGTRRPLVLAGTGSNSTAEAIRLTRHAASAGADGALVITPYYNKPTSAGLVAHFEAVADSAPDLPLVLYNVPGRTAVNMRPETVAEVARRRSSVVGIKEATGDLRQVSETIAALRAAGRDDFAVLSGDDFTTLPLLSVGGCGVISVTANVVPDEVAALCAAFARGDLAEARRLHHRHLPLAAALFTETNPIPVKWAVHRLGRCGPALRLPLVGPSPATRERVDRALRDLGLL